MTAFERVGERSSISFHQMVG